MVKLEYGCRNGLCFNSEQDFFIVLGVLANNNYTSIVWEHNENQGAWGSEGRIKIMKHNQHLTKYLQTYFTAGVGNILNRINCNAYVQYLNSDFNIQNNTRQNGCVIKNIVQTKYHQYMNDFNLGYNS